MSLEQLAVVSAPQITFDSKYPDRLTVEFTPTVPHCGMSTFIGEPIKTIALLSDVLICVRARNQVFLSVYASYGACQNDTRSTYASSQGHIKANMHVSIHGSSIYITSLISPLCVSVNKQLNDKERVAAALENPALLEVLEQCLSTAGENA